MKRHDQQGFLIPLAIFILVIMAVLALSIARMATQVSVSGAQEVVSVQTFYAAQSGAEQGMQTLYFPDASTRLGVDTRCAALNQTFSYNVTGLKGCSALVTCSCVYQDGTACNASSVANYGDSAPSGKLSSVYTITSVGTCGAGAISATRTVEVGSFMKQE